MVKLQSISLFRLTLLYLSRLSVFIVLELARCSGAVQWTTNGRRRIVPVIVQRHGRGSHVTAASVLLAVRWNE